MADCKFCAAEGRTEKPEEQCFEHCHVAPDGKHVPDPRSAVQTNVNFVIDIYCKNCSKSGGVKINPNDIQWE